MKISAIQITIKMHNFLKNNEKTFDDIPYPITL